jgi:adenosylcobinamide kinase/adenosylcobinamide-phosphate guanylyltransferase
MTTRRGFTLIGGGARSGKSAFAVQLALERGEKRIFVATAEPFDDEMRARIALHIAERGRRFDTLEAPRDLDDVVLRFARKPELEKPDVLVIDCLTLWLSNLLLADLSPGDIAQRLLGLTRTLVDAPFHTLLVTSEVGMGVVPEHALGRLFRDIAGRAHQECARAASEVYFAALGMMLRLKPGPVASMSLAADP